MSLFSIMNSLNAQSTATDSTTASLLQQIAAAKTNTATISAAQTTSGGTTSSAAYITADAKRAAAADADAAKTSADLAAELRKTLDDNHKDGAAPDMSEFSGRALATIALNQQGGFSHGEMITAKAELRARDRASALAFMNGNDLTAANLLTYGKTLLAARASMSPEETRLRDLDPTLR